MSKSLIRFRGRPPISAHVDELQRLRCGLCGTVSCAPSPKEAGEAKYEPTVATVIGLLKYGTGFPFSRLEKTQAYVEQPLEPNSALGAAINDLLKHWQKLTLFVRQAGVPLDNNIAERTLKKSGPAPQGHE